MRAAEDPLPTSVGQALESVCSAPKWWLALSGGRDSIVLLDMVHRWLQSHKGPELHAIHIHHGLSDRADHWARLCEQHCADRGVPFECHRVSISRDLGLGLEAAAREARYAIFENRLGPGEVLMQGHHQDDQVETVLYRLLRGAGPRGLAGIPATRSLGVGRIVRPLLTSSRAEITAWAEASKLLFEDDPSNVDTSFDRNFLRHEVLPLIATRWPSFRQTVTRAALLQQLTLAELDQCPLARISGLLGEPGLRIDEGSDNAALSHQLYRWLVEDAAEPPNFTQLSEFARQSLEAHADRLPELIFGNQRLVAWQGAIYRLPIEMPTAVLPSEIVVGMNLTGDWGSLYWEADCNGLPEGLFLSSRCREPREKFALRGRRSREFKQFCQEQAIPPWWRAALTVLEHDGVPVCLLGVSVLRGADDIPYVGGIARFSPRWLPFQSLDRIE